MTDTSNEDGRPLSSLATRVSFPDSVLYRDLGTEAVVLELGTGQYYGLDEIALRMVMLLKEHGHVEPVYRALLEEYSVSQEQLRLDLLTFVDLLASRNLLHLDEE
jgi:hypothetical protein